MGRVASLAGALLLTVVDACGGERSPVAIYPIENGEGKAYVDTRMERYIAPNYEQYPYVNWRYVEFHDLKPESSLDRVVVGGQYGDIVFEGEQLSLWQDDFQDARKVAEEGNKQ